MPNPSEGYPLAAAISPRVQVIETTDSTNADVVRHVTESPAQWPHLSVLLTNDQRAGRGRLDRTWTAPPGTALAMSVLVRVDGIPPRARGWVPLAAGAAMTDAVAAQLRGTGHSAGLKWPNDVLLDNFKLAGILAEVVPEHPHAIVIGVGVNTRMPAVDLPVETATSFEAMGLEADEDRLVADFLRALDDHLAALAAAHGDAVASGLHAAVQERCTTIDSDVAVALPGGASLGGRATGVDAEGRLVVQTPAGVEVPVSAGDVVHVR